MLRRISLFVHGNMNLMYGIGAITPLIVLNSLFLILVMAVFRAVITVSSATLVHCLLWIGCYYNLLYVSRLLWYFVNFIVSYIISIAFCIVLFLEGGGWCCLLFCLLLELWFGVSFNFFIFFYRYTVYFFIFKKNTFHHIALILTLISCQTYKVWFYSVSPSL